MGTKVNWREKRFSTKVIHGGQAFDKGTGALATPIYQTSTFCFETVEEGAGKFDKSIPGFVYSRGGNPTNRALEEKCAIIEGGEDCVATASGMGAIGSTMVGLLRTGDHIVTSDTLYGGTDVLMRTNMEHFGIEVSFVDMTDAENVRKAIKENTKVVYLETPANPTMAVADIKAIANIAHEAGDIKVVVDSTFAPPPVQFPLALGADIVVHSVTKYLNGHGDVIGGVVIGKSEDIAIIRGIGVTKLNGTPPSPFNSYLVLRGMKTLDIRVKLHCENAMEIAKFLEGHEYIEKVHYPGLESHPGHEIAKVQMNEMYGGMLAFELKEDINGMSAFEAGKKLVNNLTIPSIAVSLGDPDTLVEHPASMTHASVPKEEREKIGITDGLIRLSVGLESAEDLIEDFENSFKQI
ncbi:MAG: PLP-dependent transferase [Tissierellia bacterium]|nr:PLP-dependent transferase [Tissierellia bacterium]